MSERLMEQNSAHGASGDYWRAVDEQRTNRKRTKCGKKRKGRKMFARKFDKSETNDYFRSEKLLAKDREAQRRSQ